ncbi:MAG: cytochrome C oxidase subunit IV family protein [Gemmatimonadetes bacterium]|jgi:caa(3)-type oxidase subunit IV|nr:cytochrome C oxidase subunit IV family protein [Gemmatimonadota bacterium]
MTSETHEVEHDIHDHPTNRTYVIIGVVLTVLTGLEIGGYVLEERGTLGPGSAALIISVLSAAKFILVVMFYMHLKFDSRVFTGIFLFPAALATLVIAALFVLYHILGQHGNTSTLV